MLFIILFLLFAVEPAFVQPVPKVEIVMGQQKSGTLAGNVIGLDGEEVSQAPIEAKSIESGRIFKTASAVNGSYSLTELPAGRYEISSPVAGFERKQVEIQAGETTRMDIRFVEPGRTLGTIGDNDLASGSPRTTDRHLLVDPHRELRPVNRTFRAIGRSRKWMPPNRRCRLGQKLSQNIESIMTSKTLRARVVCRTA